MTAATYDGDGLRTSATTTPVGGSSSTQSFVWNTVPSVPELLMDSDNAYIYGPSGTPFEQVDLSSRDRPLPRLGRPGLGARRRQLLGQPHGLDVL